MKRKLGIMLVSLALAIIAIGCSSSIESGKKYTEDELMNMPAEELYQTFLQHGLKVEKELRERYSEKEIAKVMKADFEMMRYGLTRHNPFPNFAKEVKRVYGEIVVNYAQKKFLDYFFSKRAQERCKALTDEKSITETYYEEVEEYVTDKCLQKMIMNREPYRFDKAVVEGNHKLSVSEVDVKEDSFLATLSIDEKNTFTLEGTITLTEEGTKVSGYTFKNADELLEKLQH